SLTPTTAPSTIAWEWRSIASSRRQSKAAIASARTGAPVESVTQFAPSKRRAPCAPPCPLKRWASASCRAAMRLMENAPASRNPARVEDERARQTMSVGGASERDATETTVQPRRVSPAPQATIATPEARARIAWRKAAPSAWRTRRSLTRAPRVSPRPEGTSGTPSIQYDDRHQPAVVQFLPMGGAAVAEEAALIGVGVEDEVLDPADPGARCAFGDIGDRASRDGSGRFEALGLDTNADERR